MLPMHRTSGRAAHVYETHVAQGERSILGRREMVEVMEHLAPVTLKALFLREAEDGHVFQWLGPEGLAIARL